MLPSDETKADENAGLNSSKAMNIPAINTLIGDMIKTSKVQCCMGIVS
jgi:hypothetical protein